MADTDIKFRVSQTGAEKTAQDFKKVDNSVNQMESGSIKATKGLGSLGTVGRQVGTSLASSVGLTGGIGRVVGSLIAGGGLTFALGAATIAIAGMIKEASGFNVDEFIKKIRDMKSESEAAAEATDKMTEALDKLTTPQLMARIDMLSDRVNNIFNRALLTYGIGAKQFAETLLMLEQLTGQVGSRSIMTTHIPKTGSYAENIKAQIKEFTRLRDEVSQTKDEYDRYNSMIKMYNDLLKDQTRETKKVTKAVEEYAKVLERVAAGQGATIASGAGRVNRSFGIDATRRIRGGDASSAMISQELQNQMKQTQDLIGITAGVLRDEFTQAWEDVFGEANSLFEKFAMRIAEYFTELALRQAAMGLFNLIFPGAGTIVGAASKAGSSPASPGMGIYLDGDKFGEFVDRRVPYSVNRAVRLDIL